ncbi:hypothetical protein C8Q72DRAFT_884773 [Fomitopsis betulina]|nr:hypothetical protein C8Q72DRAFT_884773 [Fomitopsis betulina]
MTHPQDVVEATLAAPHIPAIDGVLNIKACIYKRSSAFPILAPFFACQWKASHNAHHISPASPPVPRTRSLTQWTVASIERDKNYVPYERSNYPTLSPKARARTADYLEVLDEIPLLTVAQMLVMQCTGGGFTWLGIFLSNIGLLGMGYGLYSAALIYGWKAIFMYYFVPYMLCNHWYICSAPLPI